MIKPHLSTWTEAEGLVFLSGQLPFDEKGAISEENIDGQTKQVLRNIANVLRQAGLSLKNVVKTTVWLKNVSDFQQFNESYAQMFGDHLPARSTVASDLMLPQALVEIEVVARRPRV